MLRWLAALRTALQAERDAKEQALREAEAISTFSSEVFSNPNPRRDGRTITVAETLDEAAKDWQLAKLGETVAAGEPPTKTAQPAPQSPGAGSRADTNFV